MAATDPFPTVDPMWETRLKPRLSEVSQLLHPRLPARLHSAKLISSDEEQRLTLSTASDDELALEICGILQCQPPGSFDLFCDVILDVGDGTLEHVERSLRPRLATGNSDGMATTGKSLPLSSEDETDSGNVKPGTFPDLSDKEKEIYERAMLDGGVDVEHVNIKVLGRDRAGKSCFTDSLENKEFSPDTASTEAVTVRTLITSTSGWKEEEQQSDSGHDLDKTAKGSVTQEQHDVALTRDDASVVVSATAENNEEPPRKIRIGMDNDKDIQPGGAEEPGDESSSKETRAPQNDEEETSSLVETFRKDPEISQIKKEVQVLQVWDFPSHQAFWIVLPALLLIQPSPFNFSVCMLVFNLCNLLSGKAQNPVFVDNQHGPLHQPLRWMETEGDFLSYLLTLLRVTVTNSQKMMLGEIQLPPVFGIGTHADTREARENVQKQSETFTELVKKSGYIDHLVFPDEYDDSKPNMFCIDNTKSGSADMQHRDGTVAQVCELVQKVSSEFWKKYGRLRVPVRFVRLQKMVLKLFLRSGIFKVNFLKELAKKVCGIADEEEFFLALKFLSSMTFIFYFPNVVLLNELVISPQWTFNVVAAFATVERPDKRMKEHWQKLKSTGIMSLELSQHLLEIRGLVEERYPAALQLFSHLGLLSPCLKDGQDYSMMQSISASEEFFVPFLIEEEGQWAGLAMSDVDSMKNAVLPPPLIFRPNGVDLFPEPIYFQFLTKLVFNFPIKPNLKRNVCVFHLNHGLDLEVVYHAVRYLIVTVSSSEKNLIVDDSELGLFCSGLLNRLHRLLLQATQLNMSGFRYETCFQAPSERPVLDVNPDELVSLDHYPKSDILLTEKGRRLSELQDCPTLSMWFTRPPSSKCPPSWEAVQRAVINNGADQWYSFGVALGYTNSKITANTADIPAYAGKLESLTMLLSQEEGKAEATCSLLRACRQVPDSIIGAVEDELKCS